MTEEQRIRHRRANHKYEKSSKGKATLATYHATEAYKVSSLRHSRSPAHNKARAKYLRGPTRKAWLVAYNESDKLKAVRQRHRLTPQYRFSYYKTAARKRGLLFALTFKQFMTFWRKDCHYCGDPIETIGLDRVDNTQGYTLANVVPCCGYCNWCKREKSQATYVAHCTKVAQHLKLK